MKIVKVTDVKKQDSSNNPIFRGKVSSQEIIPGSAKELRISQINFAKGARNIMHAHTFDQVLYVTEGKGIVATEKEETIVTPGTIIVIPAGEQHWHGATKDSAFSHIAIMPPGDTKF
jgi:quercetin dioxygenase-like cupin family protein